MGMDNDFKRDGLLSQLMRRISQLETFEREYRLKKIGGGGAVAFEGARITNTGVQSIPNASITQIILDEVNFDTGIADAANNRLIIATAGVYMISASVRLNMTVAAARFTVWIADETGAIMQIGEQYGAAGEPGISVATLIQLAAAKQLKLFVYQNSGAAKDTDVGTLAYPHLEAVGPFI